MALLVLLVLLPGGAGERRRAAVSPGWARGSRSPAPRFSPGVHLFVRHAADPGFPSDHATAPVAIATAVFLRDRRWGGVLLALAAVLADAVGRLIDAVRWRRRTRTGPAAREGGPS